MPLSRRDLLGGAAASTALLAVGCGGRTPAVVRDRPRFTHGLQAGEVSDEGALIWARCDRPARMRVEWDTVASFRAPRRVDGPTVTPGTDLTGLVALRGLPPGQVISYRVWFEDGRARSEPAVGRFATPPGAGQPWRFAWSGDTCGQGWGINPEWKGLFTYASIRAAAPAFFLHSGDLIYADNPILPEQRTFDGRVWKNRSDETLARVAESLDDFRRRFAYVREDEHVRALSAEVPIVAQWDDHETRNNWWPGQILDDPRYQRERQISVLSERARRATLEWTPIGQAPDAGFRRTLRYGPHLEIFVLDLRSWRGPNDANRGSEPAPMMGRAQAQWLVDGLATSTATWKIVACDQPIALEIADGEPGPDGIAAQEGYAQRDPAALGRELELAAVLRALHQRGVRDVVWLTADVHYAAAHHFDPARGTIGEFTPFWEFVAGPLHAGSFGPNPLDPTFGPEARFVLAPPPGTGNLAPWDGYQSFGTAELDGASLELTVRLHGGDGRELYRVRLPRTPEPR